MPKTKVRKSRVRKSRTRKSLRTKRGGTRDKTHRTESKAEKSVNVQYDPKRYQKSMSRTRRSPTPTPPSDIEAMTMSNSELNAFIKKTESKPLPLPKMGLGNITYDNLPLRDRKYDYSRWVLPINDIKNFYRPTSKEDEKKYQAAVANGELIRAEKRRIRNEARHKRDEARHKKDEESLVLTAQNDSVA